MTTTTTIAAAVTGATNVEKCKQSKKLHRNANYTINIYVKWFAITTIVVMKKSCGRGDGDGDGWLVGWR